VSPRIRALTAALAGPLLIAATGAWILRAFLFQGLTTDSDVITFWLPQFTELGRALGDGHVPAWTTHVLGGQPFAADPHSGWMQLLVMALFSTLRPALALGLLVGVQPILGGLGLYAFLRGERASRAAATVSGLILTVALAATRTAVTVRFSAVVAYAVLALAAASRLAHARRWPARVGWSVAAAAAWGQAVSVHVTFGAALTSLLLAAYLIPVALRARADGVAWRRLVASAALLGLAIVAVNLAVLVPRAALLPGTSIEGGYDDISRRSLELTGMVSPPYPGKASGREWPLNLAVVPGIPMGVAALACASAGWWSARRRPLVIAFSALGVLCYLLTLRPVIEFVHGRLGFLPLVDQYLHGPEWFALGLIVCLAVLAGLGVEAWAEPGGWRRRALMLGVPAAAWLVLAAIAGAGGSALVPAFLAIAGLGVAIAVTAARPAWAATLLAAIVVAGLVGPLVARAGEDFEARQTILGRTPPILEAPRLPGTDLDAYLTPRAIATVLGREGGRFVGVGRENGRPISDVRALHNNEGMLFGLESAGGYRSLQPDRTWTLLRALSQYPVRYNRATVADPPRVYLDVLGIEWLIAGRRPAASDPATVRSGRWSLYRRASPPPRASLVGAWVVADEPEQALRRLADPGFDVDATVILEEEPSVGPSGAEGSAGVARYRPQGEQAIVVEVDARRPAMVLIRNPYDPGWSATVDGEPAPVLVADYAVTAVAVPPGHHVVRLAYDDPSIGLGLAGSAVALAGFGLAAAAPALLRRRRTAPPQEPPG
jgi:hypothetical protein